MLQKILLFVVLSIGAVVSIVDPKYFEKSQPYRRDPYIARELQRHQHSSHHSADDYNRRLSVDRYQQGENVEQQQERHANYGNGRDYANNIDEYYGGCPSGFTGQLPYPYDCRRFVNCWKGRAFIQTCGAGTVFNDQTNECDHLSKVVCRGIGGAQARTDTPPSTHRLARVVQDDVSCPPGHTGLLPHPYDCSKFLNCASGAMHVQNCGPYTMFDPTKNVCDFASKVDCSGRGDGSYSSPSPVPLPAAGRGSKTFETNGRDNQAVSQQVPQRKGGWPHQHHHHHHGFQHGYPSSPGIGSASHSHHNCTEEHGQATNVYQDRWSTMNRTRPSAPGDTPTWQQSSRTPTIPDRSWPRSETSTTRQPPRWTTRPTITTTTRQPSRWQPVPQTTSTPQPTWQSHGSSGGSWTTPRPSSNYPNFNYGNNLPTNTTTTTNIYYAQPVDDDQPSEEVFSNVSGGDITEISLPGHQRPSYPSTDTGNVPNPSLLPPHSDETQSPIPEQYPDYSSLYPSYTPPQQERPGSLNRWSPPVDRHPKMDAMDIPSQNLMPPHRAPPSDDRPSQSSPYPSYSPTLQPRVPPPQPSPRPSSFDRPRMSPPSAEGEQPSVDAVNVPNSSHPQGTRKYWPLVANPSFPTQPSPGSSRFNTTTIFIHTSTPPPSVYDESNLFGGLLPPLPSDPVPSSPSSGNSYHYLLPPAQTPIPIPTTTTTYPSDPEPSNPWDANDYDDLQSPPHTPIPTTRTTTPGQQPPTGVKTNVRTIQIYPIVRNATTRSYGSPFYSPSYSGVAHSRNTSWSTVKTANPTPRSATPTYVPENNHFEPEIIFSHDEGVVVPNFRGISTTTERHGVSPPNYNREFYKQTTPSSVYRAPAETNTSDEVGQMPISEALRLLLRPYFNRSGTVTDDMATKAESHIMNLSRTTKERTTSPSTSTTTTTTTTTTTVAPEIDKDVEIVFAGEQNSLTPNHAHPIHSPVHNHHNHHHHPQPSKFHQHQHHSRDFHQQHPHIPNPFANELDEDDESEHAEVTTTPKVKDPALDDVCQFDCGNGKCVKAFETCDGINNCGNRKDEEVCDHLGYDIRLSNENGGRVEVKILGQWGYVCDDKFGILDAKVVCRELGFPLGASEVQGNSFYPPPDGEEVSFVMDEVDCSGNETSLKDCPFMGWGVSDCGPDEIVGVQCKTPVMKCPNDYWLCSTSKECIPPAFVCDNVPDCSDQSDESIAVCNSTVEYRLKGGRSKHEGRLEVLYRGVWGTVCDDDFGQTEAQVACNSMGHYGIAKIVKNAFGPGTGPIWLDQVSCFGNESTIDTCNHWSWGEHNCNHTEDVSLKCTAGSAPRSTNTRSNGRPTDDVQTTTSDDIGMDLYPMERSSKFANTRKVCGHFNANLTEELPREFERVVKGNVAKRGHHPWQATIRTKGRGGISSHWCGAVLISKKHLLTAAHCLVGYPKGAYFIRLGDHYANIAESSEIDSYIENWYIHEKFRDGTHMNNDIALIVMKNPVRFNDYIQPICLPQEGTEYKEGRRCTISGWGSIQSGVSTPSNNLRVAEIPVISDEVCKLPHVYGNSITEGMFCAGFLEEGVDACEGDSGGPFVCSDSDAETLYGIISWGQQCGHANKPGVYVKIEKYLNWIYEKIRFSMQQTN